MYKLLFLIILGLAAGACSQSGNSSDTSSTPKHNGKKGKKDTSNQKFAHLSPEQLEKMRTANVGIVIVDVRTPEEIAQGKIPEALEIDYQGKDFEKKIDALDREKAYVVYCASGNRSSKACNVMRQKGFKNVYNLDGGYKDWEKVVSQ